MTIYKFSEETTNIVDDLNLKLLKIGRLSTNPNQLFFHSYDAYDLENNNTPPDSLCRFTITGLKSIFPLLKINLGDNNKIIVEDKILEGFSAIPNNKQDHVDYIKEMILDIFLIYQNDESKIPKDLYEWYFNK